MVIKQPWNSQGFKPATIGIDVGGTSIRAGVIDHDGSVLDTVRVPTPHTQAELEDAICEAVEWLRRRPREAEGRNGEVICAVGLAVAGFVGIDRKTVLFAPHLAWRGEAVAARIGARFDLPVVLEHDANAAAVAEHRLGAARGSATAIVIAIGTGIGAGLIVDGSVYRGGFGVAPELGHLCLVPNGRSCPCGKQGCWERYCSGTALATTAAELLRETSPEAVLINAKPNQQPSSITGRQVAAAAFAGDRVAVRAMEELARWLGNGLALVADVYDPEAMVIAGGVSSSAKLFLTQARDRYVETVTGARHRPLARVVAAELGENAAIVGAGLIAQDFVAGI